MHVCTHDTKNAGNQIESDGDDRTGLGILDLFASAFLFSSVSASR